MSLSKYNLFLELAYKGTDFSGSQIQNNGITIQELLNRALSKLFNQKLIKTVFSGRTDAGVHALGQCVTVKVERKIPEENVSRALNTMLPPTIRIKNTAYKELDFHAQYSAKSRSYIYNIYCGLVPPVYLADFVWSVDPRIKLNYTLMRKAAKLIRGRHDFSAVCATQSNSKDKIRVVKKSEIKISKSQVWPGSNMKDSLLISYFIEADGFLYHMVRNIISALYDIGRGKMTIAQFKKVLAGKQRTNLRSITAPPQGLVLYKVKY